MPSAIQSSDYHMPPFRAPSLPPAFKEGSKVFQKLRMNRSASKFAGNPISEILMQATKEGKTQSALPSLSESIFNAMDRIFKETNHANLKNLWQRVDKELHLERAFPVEKKDAVEQLNTTLGVLYTALMEEEGTIEDPRILQDFYSSFHLLTGRLSQKVLPEQTPKDHNAIVKTLRVLDKGFKQAIERINQRIKEGSLNGEEIQYTQLHFSPAAVK